MALAALQQYLEFQEISQDIRQELNRHIQELTSAGFEDVPLTQYIKYIKSIKDRGVTQNAIATSVMAYLNSMAANNHLTENLVISAANTLTLLAMHSEELANANVANYKQYLSQTTTLVLESLEDSVTTLENAQGLANFFEENSIETVAEFLEYIDSLRKKYYEMKDLNRSYNLTEIILELYNKRYIDKIRATILLTSIIGVAKTRLLVGEYISSEYPNIELIQYTNQLDRRILNALLRSGYTSIGLIKYELLEGNDEFPVNNIGENALSKLIIFLLRTGYINHDQLKIIAAKYQLTIEIEG